ncbi:MAG: hypothetical protein FP816_16270 [Desulfobacteraceae bacterium]|nr:hypothetical protein [Desulfobacteraceae bacterium]MBU4002872.1 hypothetical protein [Pseudomonadota bacterium]
MENLRNHDRVTLKLKPAGVMKLIFEDKAKDIQYIGDISPFGIMVQLNYAITLNTEVSLVHTLNNTNLEIIGTVKWVKVLDESLDKNAPRSKTVSLLGICFSPQNVKENLDFFNSLIVS